MTARLLRTLLVGAGKIGAAYAQDERTRRFYRYAAHGQVLAEHPAFDWVAVVDRDSDAAAAAGEQWGVTTVARDIDDRIRDLAVDVAVLAIPPRERLAVFDALPSLKGVLVEKPLGEDLESARRFVERCAEHGVVAQVNLWRRCDRLMRQMADDLLRRKIGAPRLAFGLYGNGLINNGSHLVDLVRMLLGEVAAVRAVGNSRRKAGQPIASDIDVPFWLTLGNGISVAVQALDFDDYREVGLDIWGASGRCTILNEGLSVTLRPRRENRAVSGAAEIDDGAVEALEPTVGTALYDVYDNLARAMAGTADLWSPARSALATTSVIDAIERSAAAQGAEVRLDLR